MTPEQNNAVAETFFTSAWNEGDWGTAEPLLASNVVDHSPVPGGQEGGAEFKAIVNMFRAALPDVGLTIRDEVFAEDKVVHRWEVRGTHTGEPLLGAPASGEEIILTGITWLRMANGKIVERWTQLDMLGLMQRLGLIPSQN